jgi:hypothetical protein
VFAVGVIVGGALGAPYAAVAVFMAVAYLGSLLVLQARH